MIGLIDGPVATQHRELNAANLKEISRTPTGSCSDVTSTACMHGTFVAGMLNGKRGSAAPGICPGCVLLVRPIFTESSTTQEQVPSATPMELAQAILEVVQAGARVINLSVALVQQSGRGELELGRALDPTARKGVAVVAAAGNQGTVGSSLITRHPWVIPVVAYDLHGRLMPLSNLGNSIECRPSEPAETATFISAALASGKHDQSRATAPVTNGVATLVPLSVNDPPAARRLVTPSPGAPTPRLPIRTLRPPPL